MIGIGSTALLSPTDYAIRCAPRSTATPRAGPLARGLRANLRGLRHYAIELGAILRCPSRDEAVVRIGRTPRGLLARPAARGNRRHGVRGSTLEDE